MKIKNIKRGDILAFKAKDGKNRVIFCTSTYKIRSPHFYQFGATDMVIENKPSLKEVIECNFYGIGQKWNELLLFNKNELKKMWEFHPEIKPYGLGTYGFLIGRKEFMTFRDNFYSIGNIDIVEDLDKNGNSGINAGNWHVLNEIFINDIDEVMAYRGQKKFKFKAIIKQTPPFNQ